MTRLQKKCFVFSLALHGLLLGTLFFSAAFGTRPESTPMEILTVIPENLLDTPGSGGGGVSNPTPRPQPPAARQPAVAYTPPQPVVRPQPVVQHELTPVEPIPQPRQRETVEEAQPETRDEEAVVPAPRVSHKHHEVHPTFTPITHPSHVRVSHNEAQSDTETTSRAEQRRLQRIESAFSQLATGVEKSGATESLVDVRGIGGGSGGGPAFAGYRDAIGSIYYRAWITPDSVSTHAPTVDARIVVSRDGSIISAEVISRSGAAALDSSVRRALDSVTRLPPFPADSDDSQRSFVIRFNLELKEASR